MHITEQNEPHTNFVSINNTLEENTSSFQYHSYADQPQKHQEIAPITIESH